MACIILSIKHLQWGFMHVLVWVFVVFKHFWPAGVTSVCEFQNGKSFWEAIVSIDSKLRNAWFIPSKISCSDLINSSHLESNLCYYFYVRDCRIAFQQQNYQTCSYDKIHKTIKLKELFAKPFDILHANTQPDIKNQCMNLNNGDIRNATMHSGSHRWVLYNAPRIHCSMKHA